MAVNLLEQLGGEGFVDDADLFANTGLVRNGTNTDSILNPLSVFGTTNEKWLRPLSDTSGSQHRVVTFTPTLTDQNGYREYETSFALNIYAQSYVTTSEYNATIIRIGTNGYDSTDVMHLYVSSRAQTGVAQAELYATINSEHTTLIPTGVFCKEDYTHYITVRVRGTSSVGASDGACEIYINGDLVVSRYNQEWDGQNPTKSDFVSDNASLHCVWNGARDTQAGPRPHYRNFSMFDGWTTMDGVAPPFKHIQDMKPTTVSGDFQKVGTAATAQESLLDNQDNTYLNSETPGDVLLVGYTPDPLLVDYDATSVMIHARASRGGPAPNSIKIEAMQNTTVLGTYTQQLNVIGPTREALSTGIVFDSPIPAPDFSIKTTNGS